MGMTLRLPASGEWWEFIRRRRNITSKPPGTIEWE
jgi:GMP synthase PP-ATPase subunit